MRTAVLFFLTVFCSSSLQAQQANPHPAKDSLELLLKKYELPGLGYAVFNLDSIVYSGGCGFADLNTRMQVSEDTRFRAGSITKLFLALSFLSLEGLGKINLNADADSLTGRQYLQNPYQKRHPILLQHLLSHTAGFDDMHFNEFFLHPGEGDPNMAPENILQRNSASRISRWEPGSRHSYANPGYTMAALALEKITQMNWDDFMVQQVLLPLQMKHTTLTQQWEEPNGLAKGYENNVAASWLPIWHRPAGSMVSTAGDLAQAGMFLLTRGRSAQIEGIDENQIHKMEKPCCSFAASAGLELGYGLGNYSGYRFGRMFHGHEGGITGFYSVLRYYPGSGCGVVMLFNSGFVEDSASWYIENLLLREWMRKPAETIACRASESAAISEGWYAFASERNEIFSVLSDLLADAHIYRQEGAYYISGLGQKARKLLPCRNGIWRSEESPGPDFAAGKHEGIEWIQFQNSYFEKEHSFIPWLKWTLAIGACLTWTAYLLFFLISLIARIGGYAKGKLLLRLLPAVAILSLAGIPFLISGLPMADFGLPTPRAWMIWMCSIAFPLFSILACVQWYRLGKYREKSLFVRILAYSSLFFCLCGTLWTTQHGLMGLKLWNF